MTGFGAVPAADWDNVEKVLMRELTRRRGPVTAATWLVSQATDAANAQTAATARRTLEAGHDCGLGSKVLDSSGNVAWRALACFAAAVATLSPADRSEMLGELSRDSCMSLLLNYGSKLANASCPPETQSDPAYSSGAAISAASWDPYNPAAGPKWSPTAPPTPGTEPTPGGGGYNPPGPGATPPCSPYCLSQIDVPEAEKPYACQFLCDPATTIAALQLAQQAYAHRGFPQAAQLAGWQILVRSGQVPQSWQPPAWCWMYPDLSSCQPPGGAGPEQPVPAPPSVNWGCQPFPQCLADGANFPPGVQAPCQPWPSCICSGQTLMPGCPGGPPPGPAGSTPQPQLPNPSSAPPGGWESPVGIPPSPGAGQTVGATGAISPWYQKPAGMALIAVTAGLAIVAVVAAARA